MLPTIINKKMAISRTPLIQLSIFPLCSMRASCSSFPVFTLEVRSVCDITCLLFYRMRVETNSITHNTTMPKYTRLIPKYGSQKSLSLFVTKVRQSCERSHWAIPTGTPVHCLALISYETEKSFAILQ